MGTTAIICEYNVLHNGHKYQISTQKDNGNSVVAIMSSDFVQRGEAAVLPRHERARAALLAGCDLVLELPVPYSFASAEYFARAGVYIANAIGVCDTLSFGSEAGDINTLMSAAQKLASEEFVFALEKIYASDKKIGVQQARALCAQTLYGDDFAALISKSNNILALEYIKSLKILEADLSPQTIKRVGDGYNDTDGKGSFVSAAFLRELIKKGTDIAPYVPPECNEVYKSTELMGASLSKLESALLAFFRLSDPSSLEGFAESFGGLAHRLCTCARKAKSLDEFFTLAATKKYTNARLRRAVLSCILGVYNADFKKAPTYTRVLAANKRGCALLKEAKKSSKIEIITSGKPSCKRAAELLTNADALYALAFNNKLCADTFIKKSPYIGQ